MRDWFKDTLSAAGVIQLRMRILNYKKNKKEFPQKYPVSGPRFEP
jgi:hypothetical protein